MHDTLARRIALSLVVGACTAPALAAETEVSAAGVVAAMEANTGVHAGQRRNHIKGTCAAGEFTGTEAASRYSRSALFSGKPVPVIARFSLAGGNPKAPDTARSPRGMALEFRLPGAQLHHITMLNVPVFGAANPGTFMAGLVAARPDPATGGPNPEAMRAFRASHPDVLPLAKYMESNNPPASYASSSYWGIHTFKFINAANQTTMVRWQFVPQDGEKRLSDDELKSAGPNFLEQALIERTSKGPVRWDMVLTLGEAGDAEDDPTVAWPAARQMVKIGTLTLASASAQKGAECEPINFDPLVMADGIAPTKDPVLLFRSPAYAMSFAKRLGGL